MSEMALQYTPLIENGVERFRRSIRSLRARGDIAERRRLAATLPRKADLNHLLDERTGYGMIPPGSIPSIAPAVAYAQQIRDGNVAGMPSAKKSDYNPTVHAPKSYEDAPAFFDLVLSDEILQIASDYLGEVPVLLHMKLWRSPTNSHMKGSQLYHRDGGQWTLRRAKFMVNMDAVGPRNGPFTFLPADVSSKVSGAIGSMKKQGRVTDEKTYQHSNPADAVSLIGPAGTACAVDSSRCFHHGARVQEGERLLLMFHFLRLSDAMHGGQMYRTAAFDRRFGSDPVRRLVIPNAAPATVDIKDDD